MRGGVRSLRRCYNKRMWNIYCMEIEWKTVIGKSKKQPEKYENQGEEL